LPGVHIQRERDAGEVFRAANQGFQSCLVQAFQDKYLGAREKCSVEFEAGVLRCRTDQDDGAVLDVGQK
jgi:hypothetical protein